MHVHWADPVATVYAPAKLNLFLEILQKRADGFHEIETLMAPVARWDTLRFEATVDPQLDCESRWAISQSSPTFVAGQSVDAGAYHALRELPPADNNLALRAVQRLREAAGVHRGGKIELIKRIPMAAGMAGGSSDCAAALVAANIAWGLNWSREQLATIAAELGSDVPFFLGSHPALCSGRGEQIAPQASLAPLNFVIVQPPTGLSTAEVYRYCRPASTPRDVNPLLVAWRAGRLAELGKLLFNRLQAAAEQISPWVWRLRNEFDRYDFLGHQLTGSGSAYFGLCQSARHARRLASALRSRGFATAIAVAGAM
jgi:4-diphosphocytidyl-2-C-methyl-D-erythritol kinase